MKIAFILIVHLGLVACNNPANNVEDEKQMCTRCEAQEELQRYINSPGVDPEGAIFWEMVDGFKCKRLFDESEVANFKVLLHSQPQIVYRGHGWNAAGKQLLHFLKSKDESKCCLGDQMSCEVGKSKEQIAIKQVEDFITQNGRCSQRLHLMLNGFFVTDLIPEEQLKAYESLMKGLYKEKIKELARLLLKEIYMLNAIKEIEEYRKKVEKHPDSDVGGNRLRNMVIKYHKEGMFNQDNEGIDGILRAIELSVMSEDWSYALQDIVPIIENDYLTFVEKLLEG